MLIGAIVSGCGGGEERNDSLGTKEILDPKYATFGVDPSQIFQQALLGSDSTNDSLARSILEAGSIGAYVDLSPEEQLRLRQKYSDSARNQSETAHEEDSRVQILSVPPDALTACVQYLASQHRNKGHRLANSLHVYAVDSIGRPEYARAVIRYGSLSPSFRDNCSTTVGSWGTASAGTPLPVNGYVGGHLIAASLGGSPARINLTPQAQQINASTFARIESAVRYCGGNPRWMVDYMITPRYSPSSPLTPDSYLVWVRVNGSMIADRIAGWGGEGAIIIPNWTGVSGMNTLQNINLQVDLYSATIRAVCPL